MKDFLKAIVYAGLFAVPFLVLIVANDLFFPFITGKNFAFRVVVEVIFAAWVLLAMLEPKYRPQWSWILGGFGALLVVMFFANLFGAHPPTSFWSNYERMEGYVTLVHLFGYFLVLGSTLRSPKHWQWFWYTTLVAAGIVALDGLQEYLDPDSPTRVAGMLGNAAYLAIYMLFHIFLTFYLFARSTNVYERVALAGLSALFAFILLQTSTRGTAIGLVVGLGTMASYLSLFAVHNPQFRKTAIGIVALGVVTIGGFWLAKDAAFVQDSPTLARIANIDLQEDLEVRATIWGMAWEGVQQRPVLGWGQGNFNYVFNAEYDPFLYDQEQWFDRTHNIFLDWLIAGGALGFIAYFSIFAAAVYYLVRRQRNVPEEQRFSVLEQSVLLGLLAAYLTHNLVVFDNIISYLFYASLLAMIHARVGVPAPSLQAIKIAPTTVRDVALPAAIVLLGSTIYFVNIPSLQAAGDLITALRTNSAEERLAVYDRALDRGSFAEQEIAEQLMQQAMQLQQQSDVPQDVREKFLARAEEAMVDVSNQNPNDARVRVFLAAFYRGINEVAEAREQLERAAELSPNKPSIVIQQGANEIAAGDIPAARDFFQDAYELDTRNTAALTLYLATLYQNEEPETAREVLASHTATTTVQAPANLIQSSPLLEQAEYYLTEESDTTATGSETIRMVAPEAQYALGNDQYARNVINNTSFRDLQIELFELQVLNETENPQPWASLSFLYYEADDTEQSIETLNRAALAVPEFATTAECFAENIRAGNEPQAGC